MDTSKEYVKMSDCPEIQGSYETGGRLGNFYAWKVGVNKGKVYVDMYPGGKDTKIWLPRQDQIQEMLREGSACSCFLCLTTHIHQFVENYFEGLHEGDIDTMEQLWLAFYMSEKHSKIWKDEKWIKP